MRRRALEPAPQLEQLHRAKADLLAAMADQLRQWERAIRASGPGLPLPPPVRLMLCRQAERAIRDGEASWKGIVS